MIFDLSILLITCIFSLIRRDATNYAVTLWLCCYIGYTLLIVGLIGSYVNFYVLGSISAVIAFIFTTQSKRLTLLQRLTALLMYAPFIYNLGVASEWVGYRYGVFDQFYTVFMQSIYIGMLLSANAIYLIKKIRRLFKAAISNLTEKNHYDALGFLAMGRVSNPKYSNSGSLFLHSVSNGKISKPYKI